MAEIEDAAKTDGSVPSGHDLTGPSGHDLTGPSGHDLTGARNEPVDLLHVASPARIAAATALRRLGHALVGHEVADDVLEQIRLTVEGIVDEVDAGAKRSRPVLSMKREHYDHVPKDGDTMDHFPDCIVSGKANPMGIAIDVHRDGDDAVARVSLGSAFEGAPRRAHGGIVAAVFDDTMGFVLNMLATPAFTGRLSVSYLAPTPVGEEIEFRARLRERDGRKLWIAGEATWNGDRILEAEGLFITIPLERFGIGARARREG